MLAWELVADTTAASNTTTVSFTGLNITKDDEYLIVCEVKSGAAAGWIRLFVNGNTTATNYQIQTLSGYGTSFSLVAEPQPVFVYAHSTTYGEHSHATAQLKLTNSGYVVWQSRSNSYYRTDLGQYTRNVQAYGGAEFTATSITSLEFTAVATNGIGVGSRFQLYKCVAEKIADTTISSATTSVDITGLSIGKDNEYVLFSDIVNAIGSATTFSLYANNNTTATDYYTQSITAAGTTAGSARTNSALLASNASSARSFTTSRIKLTNNGYFVCQTEGAKDYGGASASINNYVETLTSAATSITQLTVTASQTNGIASGSRFQLWKMK